MTLNNVIGLEKMGLSKPQIKRWITCIQNPGPCTCGIHIVHSDAIAMAKEVGEISEIVELKIESIRDSRKTLKNGVVYYT